MKSAPRKTGTGIAALLLGVAMLPATAGDRRIKSFQDYDANRDGYLSLKEFEATGKDNLAFKAADIDGDERLDRKEFDQYLDKIKAGDRPAPPSGNY
jgi:Ca2+-binding EF-hand superfamily protein